MSYYKDLTGQKNGRLTVLYREGSSKYGVVWRCLCDCGNYKSLSSNLLNKNNGSKSCGCLRKEFLQKHGLSRTKLHKVWDTIIQRCCNKNDSNYKLYGGRGVKVCEEWKNDFKKFYDWAYENGYKEEQLENGKNKLTIDRIDVNGDYCPENCRWVTMKEQCNNRRNNIFLTINNETKTIAQWSDCSKIKVSTIFYRMKSGKVGYELIAPVKNNKG